MLLDLLPGSTATTTNNNEGDTGIDGSNGGGGNVMGTEAFKTIKITKVIMIGIMITIVVIKTICIKRRVEMRTITKC